MHFFVILVQDKKIKKMNIVDRFRLLLLKLELSDTVFEIRMVFRKTFPPIFKEFLPRQYCRMALEKIIKKHGENATVIYTLTGRIVKFIGKSNFPEKFLPKKDADCFLDELQKVSETIGQALEKEDWGTMEKIIFRLNREQLSTLTYCFSFLLDEYEFFELFAFSSSFSQEGKQVNELFLENTKGNIQKQTEFLQNQKRTDQLVIKSIEFYQKGTLNELRDWLMANAPRNF